MQATLALLAIALVNYLSPCSIFTHVDQFYQSERSVEIELFTPTQSHIQYLFIVYLLFLVFDRQVEYISRLDFLWASKLKLEEYDAKIMREMNKQLLKNILPIHLADKFLQDPEQRHTLYYEPYESCAVMFAAMPNFVKFYSENKKNDDGLQCLYVLNEIISEFDKVDTLADLALVSLNFNICLSCSSCLTLKTRSRRSRPLEALTWLLLDSILVVLPST